MIANGDTKKKKPAKQAKQAKQAKKKRGNPNFGQEGIEHRWKPGQSGNPKGSPKARVQFWPHVQRFSEMTTEEIEAVDKSKLTQSQLGALEYVRKLSACEWQQVKEALDRDEGCPKQTVDLNQRVYESGEVAEMTDEQVNNRIKEVAGIN